jgi:hypothetical protein
MYVNGLEIFGIFAIWKPFANLHSGLTHVAQTGLRNPSLARTVTGWAGCSASGPRSAFPLASSVDVRRAKVIKYLGEKFAEKLCFCTKYC